MSGPIALEALGEWLRDEIGDGGDDVAVLAGHFAIYSAGATATDMLDGTMIQVAGAREMLDFTARHLACGVRSRSACAWRCFPDGGAGR